MKVRSVGCTVLFACYVTQILGLLTDHSSQQLEFNSFPNISPNTDVDAPSIRRKRDISPLIPDTTGVFPIGPEMQLFSLLLSIINYQFQIGRLQTESNAAGGWWLDHNNLKLLLIAGHLHCGQRLLTSDIIPLTGW